MYAMLNQYQRSAADAILASHRKRSTTAASSCFFIDGLGSTGIATSLLPEGRTVHSRFTLPVPIIETSTSSIQPNSKEAEEIRNTQVFI